MGVPVYKLVAALLVCYAVIHAISEAFNALSVLLPK
jgi:hypothetical protein